MASRLQTQARRRASVWTHQEADITTIEHKVSFGSIATKIDPSGHFRLSPMSGSTADIVVGPVRADFVAEVR
jgi:hypothetical protein